MFDFTSLGFKKIKDLKPESVFLVEDEKGERFVLKTGPAAQRLVKFSQMVHQAGGDLGSLMPAFWAKDNWFWQKFLTWELAGDTVKTYGIKAEAFAEINPEKLAQALLSLQTFPFSDVTLEKRKADFYLQNIGEFKEVITEELGEDLFNRIEHFLFLKKSLVDKYSHFLANGDLHPQNIMFPSTGPVPERYGAGAGQVPSTAGRTSWYIPALEASQFKVVDWDLLHFNNPGWDLTDLYVWGWRNSNWGKRLLDCYKKVQIITKTDFEKIFAFDVVYLSSQLVKHAKLIKAPEEFLEAQKKFLIDYLRPL